MDAIAAQIGSLVCRVVGDGDALTVVLCHGYGAPGTDLVGIAGEVLHARPAWRDRVRFVFPEAPLSLDDAPFAGRAWWHLDWPRLERAARDPAARAQLEEETPDGLPHARKLLRGVVDALGARTPTSRIVLGGFSQGAMVATDVALRLDEAPAGLVVFSGALLCRPEWERLAAQRAGLPVVVSHGQVDPLLPFSGAGRLADLLRRAGLVVDWAPFMGPHTIGPAGYDAFLSLVDRLLQPASG